jgi:RimJ/RimL family protein N-acetyltransferase
VEGPRQRLVIAGSLSDHLLVAQRFSKSFLATVSWYDVTNISNWPQLGIAIYDPQYWRQGIGYEAMGFMIEAMVAEC